MKKSIVSIILVILFCFVSCSDMVRDLMEYAQSEPAVNINADSPHYTDITSLSAPVCSGTVYTFTAPDGYLTYQWLLDGVVQPGVTGKTCSIDTAALSAGTHIITLIVAGADMSFSTSCELTVISRLP